MNRCNLKWISLFFAFFSVTASYSKNIGTIGQVYSIQETDFLEFIQTRISVFEQNGTLKKLQEDMQQKAVTYRDRPNSVNDVSNAQENKAWLFDPSIVLDHDVKTPDGKVIAFQGARINPLLHVPLSKALIFYNADDKRQSAWAVATDKKFNGKDKLILVKGSLLTEEKNFSHPIYFDQAGRLTKRFAIHHVPAIVSQEGAYLKINEIKL